MPTYRAEAALLPDGIATDVAIEVEFGRIAAVVKHAPHKPGAETIKGLVLPGVANVHSHAFQRAMAGLAEWDAGGKDNFWSWREAMYRFAEHLDPQTQGAIAKFLFVEMLKSGYTAVGEFHYLHNKPGGTPYAPPAAMAEAIAQAAEETGIALCLLPTLYTQGGADKRPLNERQKRFGKTVDELLSLRDAVRKAPGVASVGLAVHSLRAVPHDAMRAALKGVEPTSPLHIHAAEQIGEVEECVTHLGARPVEYLLDNFGLDERWCLVHATHMNDIEALRMAKSGAVAGLCPTTEANLGDGFFALEEYLGQNGRLAVGGDSHIAVDPAEELKALEYSQRLLHRRRNVAASNAVPHTAARLWSNAARGGAQALALEAGAIAPGHRADFAVIDTNHVSLAGRTAKQALDTYVFVAGRSAIRDVMVEGEWKIRAGRHELEEEADDGYRKAIAHILRG